MPYYIRVLGTDSSIVPIETIAEAAAPGRVLLEDSEVKDWHSLTLSHESGIEIAIVERNPVIEGELGAEEIEEFQEEVADYKPESAARWLADFLPQVKVVYCFQLLDGTDVEDGWSILHRVQRSIWANAKGILQADGEGFSNEEGYTILWQFSDSVNGEWEMGVLDEDRRWNHFKMELGDPVQREAFWRGQVPEGAELIVDESYQRLSESEVEP